MTVLQAFTLLQLLPTIKREEVVAAYDKQVEIAKEDGATETLTAISENGYSYNSTPILWELKVAIDAVMTWIFNVEESLKEENNGNDEEKPLTDIEDFQGN